MHRYFFDNLSTAYFRILATAWTLWDSSWFRWSIRLVWNPEIQRRIRLSVVQSPLARMMVAGQRGQDRPVCLIEDEIPLLLCRPSIFFISSSCLALPHITILLPLQLHTRTRRSTNSIFINNPIYPISYDSNALLLHAWRYTLSQTRESHRMFYTI